MISSITVKNFRCFPSLSLNDLGRVNIVVGDNGSGKTALLEAILLSAGVPEVVVALKQLRGINNEGALVVDPAQAKAVFDSLWPDIFTGLSSDKTVEITVEGTPENKRKARIHYEKEKLRVISLVPQLSGAQSSASPSQKQIVFESEDGAGHNDTLWPRLMPNGVIGVEGNRSIPPSAIFLHGSSTLPSQRQSVQDFDIINRRNGVPELIKAVSKVFPQVTDLTVIGNALHCSLPALPEKVPLATISNGINKLVAIMLGIAVRPGGVYMVDEIENGFYFKKMPMVWEALDTMSKDFRVQLFISTHGKEALQRFLPIVEQKPEDFRLLRVDGVAGNEHTVEMFSGNVLRAMLKTGEVDARSGD